MTGDNRLIVKDSLRGIKLENKQTLEDIYELYYRDVFHFSLYFTNNRQEAEDITQETFIKVMKSFHTIKDYSKVKVWILSITKNLAIDLHRKKKYQKLISGFLKDSKAEHEPDDYDSHMIRLEEWQIVQNALLKLKPHYRSVVILRGLKELSVKETSDILGFNEIKVRVDYHRAIKMLQANLNRQTEGCDSYEQTK